MMTTGATIIAMRGTLKRRSTNRATNPIAKAAKNAAGASSIPMSIKISRMPFAAKASCRHHDARGAVEQHSERAGCNKTCNRPERQLQLICKFKWRLPCDVDPANCDDNTETQSERQQDHYAIGQEADGGDRLKLQQVE